MIVAAECQLEKVGAGGSGGDYCAKEKASAFQFLSDPVKLLPSFSSFVY